MSTHYGNKIRDLRTSKNESQGALADRLGISRPYLSTIENSPDMPSSSFRAGFCKAFRVRNETFFDGAEIVKEARGSSNKAVSGKISTHTKSVKAAKSANSDEKLTADEKRLLSSFRSMSKKTGQHFLFVGTALAKKG